MENRARARFRLSLSLFLFAFGCVALWYQKYQGERRKQEVYELKNAIYDTIEHYVTQKGGSNIVILDVQERLHGGDRAVYSARYRFDTQVKDDTTTTHIDTDLILTKSQNAWKLVKLDNFKQDIRYASGSLVKPGRRTASSVP